MLKKAVTLAEFKFNLACANCYMNTTKNMIFEYCLKHSKVR